ncbi:hypothetical protein BBAD15_g12274 [Beauveria bassiana D1-5]|uniref:Uncharacterized protein n=1 Tax=Beauveria bassiana D1-5 TaxID=1245745 RepID=A0A0A2V4W0_BEABA|nr:hypothetical protein BBAD15_g12274 [Beauveria bassiana D1-5]
MFLERKSAGIVIAVFHSGNGWDEQGCPPTGAVPRRTASWQGCSHCVVAVAGTALRLQPPMWDTPRKRTAPWEDILAPRLALQVRPPLCDSPGRPAAIEASIQWTSQQEGHHNSIYFRTLAGRSSLPGPQPRNATVPRDFPFLGTMLDVSEALPLRPLASAAHK